MESGPACPCFRSSRRSFTSSSSGGSRDGRRLEEMVDLAITGPGAPWNRSVFLNPSRRRRSFVTQQGRIAMNETLFDLDKDISNEELGERVRIFRHRLSISSRIEPSKSNLVDGNSLTIEFQDPPRTVYCSLTNIEVTLTPTGDYTGNTKLSFLQDCNSRTGDGATQADWIFDLDIIGEQGDVLAKIDLGTWWKHFCGKRTAEIPNKWSVDNHPNLVQKYRTSVLNWRWLVEVGNCG